MRPVIPKSLNDDASVPWFDVISVQWTWAWRHEWPATRLVKKLMLFKVSFHLFMNCFNYWPNYQKNEIRSFFAEQLLFPLPLMDSTNKSNLIRQHSYEKIVSLLQMIRIRHIFFVTLPEQNISSTCNKNILGIFCQWIIKKSLFSGTEMKLMKFWRIPPKNCFLSLFSSSFLYFNL